MAVPTSYTNTTFADYLQKEVLLDAVDELGWLDIYAGDPPVLGENVVVGQDGTNGGTRFYYLGDDPPAYNSITRLGGEGFLVLTAVGNGTTVRGIEPSKYTVPAGTILTVGSPAPNPWVSDGVDNYVLANPVALGDTSITLTTALTAGATYRLAFYNDPANIVMPARTVNYVYQHIIDSTLVNLGETDITVFNTRPEIHKLRMYGRRETWKYAMQYLAGDYSLRTPAGGLAGRRDIYIHCKDMFIAEDFRISRLYGEVREQSLKQSQFYTPTTRSRVKVRW